MSKRPNIGGPQWFAEDFDLDEDEEEDMEMDEDEEEEDSDEDDEEEDGDPVAAPTATEADAKDPVITALIKRAKRNGPPSMEEARKQVRAVVHDYIVETGRIPTPFSG